MSDEVTAKTFVLDDVARQLVKDGVITVSVIFTKTGLDAYARSVDNHPRLGVSPHQSFRLDELEEVFKKHHSLKSMGKVKDLRKDLLDLALSSPGQKSGRVEPMGGGRSPPMSITQASKVLDDAHGRTIKYMGAEGYLPSDSLDWKELGRPSVVTEARAVVVASKIGNAKAVARISTSGYLSIPGVKSLHDWWDRATLEQRVTLLSKAKSLNASQYIPKMSFKAREALEDALGKCPFRDAVLEVDEPKEGSPSRGEQTWFW